ncbi:MAG: hypothetical protein ACFFCD_08070 [Promethearchaeota archaeon]
MEYILVILTLVFTGLIYEIIPKYDILRLDSIKMQDIIYFLISPLFGVLIFLASNSILFVILSSVGVSDPPSLVFVPLPFLVAGVLGIARKKYQIDDKESENEE